MALGLIFLGIVLIAVGWRGTFGHFFGLFASDVPGFLVWGAALLAIGAIGYVPELAALSNGLLVLVFLVIFISNQGVFASWQQLAEQGVPAAAPTPLVPTADQPALNQTPTINIQGGTSGAPTGASSGTPGGGILQTVAGAVIPVLF